MKMKLSIKKDINTSIRLKYQKNGNYTRVYRRINESGELIFDLILKKWGEGYRWT